MVGATATLAISSPALAVTDSCNTGNGSSCNTFYINANYSSHRIYYNVCAGNGTIGARFRIRDQANGVVVKTGSVSSCITSYVGGLYSLYRLELYNAAPSSRGTIGSTAV
ncbi:hypothetical protein Aut01nite_61810 [Actinoplanes utahensis]|nr:hypothetical protein Aut01nite_61810 [Actinoplanes utahensis]